MLSTLLSDLRQALRASLRQPAFAAVVVGTLALGIGANTAMFGIIHAALLKPLPYREPDRLVLARRTVAGGTRMWNSAPDFYDYRDQTGGFESLAAAYCVSFRTTVTGGAKPERVATTFVSHDLLSTLGVPPVTGRTFAAGEGQAGAPWVAMVSQRLAARRFGSAAKAVGRGIAVAGVAEADVSATIVGVLPASYRFLDETDLWLPMRQGENDGPQTRQFHNWVLVGRLKPGVSIDAVRRQVDVVARRLQQMYPATNKEKALRVDPLQSALLQSQTPMLMVLMGAVGLVLLIACANVAGLLLSRGVARRSELAVRAAIGASRGRLVRQLMVESLVLAVVSGAAGVALAIWLQRLLPIATGLADLGVRARGLEIQVLLFALAVSLATGIVSGVAPALRASSLRLTEQLAPGARSTDSRGGTRLRSVLVVGQVAVSLVLLVGAGLLIRSLARLAATDLGFDVENLQAVSINLPYADATQRIQFQRGLREDLAAIPGVTAVTLASHVPILHPWGDPPMWPADHPPVDSSQERTALARVVLPGYFKALGIPLLAGRDLSEKDRLDTPRVMVINEVMARTLFPGQNPLGKRVVVASDPKPLDFEVVGMVGNARVGVIGQEAYLTMYMANDQSGMRGFYALIRSGLAPDALGRAIRNAVAARDPDIPVDEMVSMNSILGDALLTRRVTAVTLTAFSGVALLLASLGLYGVLAYHVTQRRHEIGVRMALGAGTRTVLAYVLRRGAQMVVPGLVVGLLASAAVTRLMTRFLYQVEPTDPLTFAGVSGGLALVALAASVWPAWRAARIDPVQALRGE